MPVYDHRYRGWTGERRTGRFRIWTVARFALADLWKSRLALLLFILALLPPIFFGGMIYLANNIDMLAAVGWKVTGEGVDSSWMAIDKEPFFWFLVWQSSFAFFLAAFIGPTLVAPDLRTTLCRSIFRARCRAPTTSPASSWCCCCRSRR